jgi:SAM-dependent methyltransferase
MLKTLQLIFGIYPRRIMRSVKAIPWYRRTKKEFARQTENSGMPFPLTKSYPCLRDKGEDGGNASGHYFHQDLLVAQHIFKANPAKHVDIGSRIDGFVSHVASFREIEVIDIRTLSNELPNIKFVQADMMNPVREHLKGYADSVSSLHAIEHFGLGRYGDPIDVEGHLKGLANIYNLLQPGGTLYFSVPIGPQRVEFNAHRVFSVRYLLDYFEDKYTLQSFSFVDDKGAIHRNIELDEQKIANNCGCNYGCGIFILKKK